MAKQRPKVNVQGPTEVQTPALLDNNPGVQLVLGDQPENIRVFFGGLAGRVMKTFKDGRVDVEVKMKEPGGSEKSLRVKVYLVWHLLLVQS